MEVNFKFNIGDFVKTKQEVREAKIETDSFKGIRARLPVELMIIERIMHECYGGIQNYYHVRGYSREGTVLMKYSEIELELAE